jgi:hypothetical protein
MTKLLDSVSVWLILAAYFGFPVWLAWWLSDGFKFLNTVPVDPNYVPGSVSYRPIYNPYTGATCVAPVDKQTGAPRAYPE